MISEKHYNKKIRVAYKLFRLLKSGEITSLFINKKERLIIGKWMEAEYYPTKGFAVRPFWHCMEKPYAPHLVITNRIWMKVLVNDYIVMQRPEGQGGTWYLANKMKIVKKVNI